MKCSELLRVPKTMGWIEMSQKGSHIKLCHPNFKNPIIFPNHGSKEIGYGLEKKIKKQAGIK